MTRQDWRRTWLQVHQWIGVGLAILIIPLSLSGSALVWDKAIDRAMHPARYAVSGTTLLAPDAYLVAARTALAPGDPIASLSMPEGRGPVVVSAAPAHAPERAGPPMRTQVFLDPPTARVLGTGQGLGGFLRFAHQLHGQLLVPGAGRTIVGWLGVAMMVSAFTGLWLWWPASGRVARGLRWRRRPDTSSNLHHLFGFWIALPLFVLSLTGAWIAFPLVFGAVTGTATPRVKNGPDPRAAMRAPPLAQTGLPVATAIARAEQVMPGALRQVTWPTRRSADWTVTIAAAHGRPRTIKVADDTGIAVAAPAQGQGPALQLVRAIHSGEGTPLAWQVIVFVTGLVPALLAVTGIIIWWRARGRRSPRDRRRAVPVS